MKWTLGLTWKIHPKPHAQIHCRFLVKQLVVLFLKILEQKKFPSKTQKVHEQKYNIYMDPFWRVNRKIDSLNLKIDSFNPYI